MAPAIRVHEVSKQYRIGEEKAQYDTLRDQVGRGFARLVKPRRGRGPKRTIWALRDASFDVMEGEIVGLIGRNGAGKTTLLRILSRITSPTTGRAELRGRLRSLLEVGTGFHPELTGRDNIFLNGAILGMRKREIVQKFDEIVEFAGVGTFIDTPVKRYSSGMYVRLAFSVAAHLEPEILLVDEVLAVGDAEFQKRCLGKMESIGRAGRTVVLVSHSMPTIARLCGRAILLEDGRVSHDGPSEAVIATYLQSGVGTSAQREWLDPTEAPGNDTVRLRSVRIVDQTGAGMETRDVREPVGIEIQFDVARSDQPLRPQIMLTNEQGIHAFNAMDTSSRWAQPPVPGRHRTTAWIPGNLLNEGLMTVTVFLSTFESGKTLQHVLERDIVAFLVTDPVEGDSAKGPHVGQWWGAVRPLLDWTEESVLPESRLVAR